MKRILILSLLVVFSLTLFAQDKEIVLKPMGNYDTYISYTGKVADTLTVNQDTVDVRIEYRGNYVNKIAILSKFDIVDGADTLTVQLLGYDFEDDATAATVFSATTVNVGANNTVSILSDDYSGGAVELSFRHYILRYIRTGVGNGVKIKKAEFKVYP